MTDNTPVGYWKVDATEVWTNGQEVVILGNPHDEEQCPDENLSHDCDQYGCGSVTPHILYRAILNGRISAEWLPSCNLPADEVTESEQDKQARLETEQIMSLIYWGSDDMDKQATIDDLLRTLDAYVTHGGQEKAAVALGLTQYTIWNRIAILEAQKGKLLVRNGRGHRKPILNSYGKELLKGWKHG